MTPSDSISRPQEAKTLTNSVDIPVGSLIYQSEDGRGEKSRQRAASEGLSHSRNDSEGERRRSVPNRENGRDTLTSLGFHSLRRMGGTMDLIKSSNSSSDNDTFERESISAHDLQDILSKNDAASATRGASPKDEELDVPYNLQFWRPWTRDLFKNAPSPRSPSLHSPALGLLALKTSQENSPVERAPDGRFFGPDRQISSDSDPTVPDHTQVNMHDSNISQRSTMHIEVPRRRQYIPVHFVRSNYAISSLYPSPSSSGTNSAYSGSPERHGDITLEKRPFDKKGRPLPPAIQTTKASPDIRETMDEGLMPIRRASFTTSHQYAVPVPYWYIPYSFPPCPSVTLDHQEGNSPAVDGHGFVKFPAPPSTRVERTRNGKGYVLKACVNCKIAHVACDVGRPCQRCIRLGKTGTCVDAERRKRGRPPKRFTMTSTTKRLKVEDLSQVSDGLVTPPTERPVATS